MLSQRVIERIAGVLLLAFFACVIVSLVIGPVQINSSREGIGQSLRDIAQDPGARTTLSFLLAASFFFAMASAPLYSAFRPYGRELAFVGAFGMLAGGVLAVANDVLTLGAVDLAQDFVVASGAQADAVKTIARSYVQVGDLFLNTGRTAVAVSYLAFGVLIARSRALPRWLGWIGIVGGIVYPLIWFLRAGVILGIVGLIGHFGLLILNLLLGGWLVVRGTAEANKE